MKESRSASSKVTLSQLYSQVEQEIAHSVGDTLSVRNKITTLIEK